MCDLFTGKVIFKDQHGYGAEGGFVSEVNYLASRFSTLNLHAPAALTSQKSGTNEFAPNVEVCALPCASHFYQYPAFVAWYRAVLPKRIKRGHAVLCYFPSLVPVGVLAAYLCKRRSVRPVLCERGSITEVVRKSKNLPILKRHCLWCWNRLWEQAAFRVGIGCSVFVRGNDRCEKWRRRGIHARLLLGRAAELPAFDNTTRKKGDRILFVGRIEAAKGIYDLLHAVAQIAATRPGVELDCVGVQCDRGQAKALAQRLGLSGRVQFLGLVPYGKELFKLYESASVFVLPSFSEGMPNVLLEAMSAGCAVVSTNVGGIPDVIVHRKSGLLVDPGDPAALARQIEEVLANAQLRETLVAEGRCVVQEIMAQSSFPEIVRLARKFADEGAKV